MSWIVTLGVVILAGVAAYVAVRGTILYRNRSRYVVKEIPGFLSDEECAHLITRAAPFLKKSAVVGRDTRRTQIERDSGTVFLGQGGDPIVQRIKKRIAELSGTRVAQQERIQITHYDEQQRYDLHYDALSSGGEDPGAAGDRVYTVIMYLNDEYRGGTTWFPRVRQRFKPEKGKALLFSNLTPDGKARDLLAIHAGAPVTQGEKWISNQWIRQHDRHPEARRQAGQRSRKGRRPKAKKRRKGSLER